MVWWNSTPAEGFGARRKPGRSPSRITPLPDLYFYDNDVVESPRSLCPSARGELEITDVNRALFRHGTGSRRRGVARGTAWLDTGNVDSLLEAGNFVRTIEGPAGPEDRLPEEIAWRLGFIDDAASRIGRRRF